MEINIKNAYKVLAQLELLSKVKSLKMSAIEDEIETSKADLYEDINCFNDEIIQLLNLLDRGKSVETIEPLIRMRANALDIVTHFSNLVEEIDTFVQNTDLYDEYLNS
ncbi:hypothetical protein [Halobacteriovorax sp. RZ-2]|uniref:hypothetical protein n=1 Tax=unclassified Halobacteriovorax TaxID=2639665 RepID=UPI00371E95AA